MLNEIVVIDYGVGNLLSVKRGLEHCGAKVKITSKPEVSLTLHTFLNAELGFFGVVV